jgi:hypothetical protein
MSAARVPQSRPVHLQQLHDVLVSAASPRSAIGVDGIALVEQRGDRAPEGAAEGQSAVDGQAPADRRHALARLGIAPSFSYDSQRMPVPRFCQAGRSLKLTPCWKRSSFLSGTVVLSSSRVAFATERPTLRKQQ